MANHYYNAEDLGKFGNVGEFQKPMADKFFAWYGEVFAEGNLTAREKSLVALAVAHAVQCPYCIDAYSSDAFEKGWSESQIMEAVHVASAIKGGATLVHGVQMMNKVKEISM
jgi:alkylhydroperoxidase/carboxymuconolactone decarboxylase family protein